MKVLLLGGHYDGQVRDLPFDPGDVLLMSVPPKLSVQLCTPDGALDLPGRVTYRLRRRLNFHQAEAAGFDAIYDTSGYRLQVLGG